ncbi:glutamine synthetase beta-grasp domain-containing protein [Neolewinella litorea]|uniref:Glutamine synthetase n=1 Tax=Neolewinella litorea TaxID=2562452 RepID=A0A4S4N9G6_9BACT|nr:glutamine synthetase beta-grasp domain-containing protein [Neolewinella litorea]THH35017.1 glutamine synthetase [Neolewinella litorea]
MATKHKLQYVWLDGNEPMQTLRCKTRIEENFSGDLEDCPMWSFDGSSTKQAEGGSSDCLLKPVMIVTDPLRKNGFIVLCEVLNSDGSPHPTNGRATIDDEDQDFWFGFEQEYFLMDMDTDKPLGFPADGTNPPPQGPYYCAVGARRAFGREIIEKHLDACLDAGLNVEGINAEVAPGQWEFQTFAKGAKEAGDQIWMARFLLERISEAYGVYVEYHCKPLKGDWNGSGMHANFSNSFLRDSGKREDYEKVCEAFRPYVKEHIAVYGYDNHLRLTGKHETQSIDQFSFGISDRGASIRIPIATVERGWKGWLEDRRPNSAADPYKVAARIVKTVKPVSN